MIGLIEKTTVGRISPSQNPHSPNSSPGYFGSSSSNNNNSNNGNGNNSSGGGGGNRKVFCLCLVITLLLLSLAAAATTMIHRSDSVSAIAHHADPRHDNSHQVLGDPRRPSLVEQRQGEIAQQEREAQAQAKETPDNNNNNNNNKKDKNEVQKVLDDGVVAGNQTSTNNKNNNDNNEEESSKKLQEHHHEEHEHEGENKKHHHEKHNNNNNDKGHHHNNNNNKKNNNHHHHHDNKKKKAHNKPVVDYDDGSNFDASIFTGKTIYLDWILDHPNGTIRMKMRPDGAPRTVANMIRLAREGKYNKSGCFYRYEKGFVLQGGQCSRSDRKTVPLESNLPNVKYSVAMARTSNPHSGGTEFFINLANNHGLDKKNGGYAVWAELVPEHKETFELIAKLKKLPVHSSNGKKRGGLMLYDKGFVPHFKGVVIHEVKDPVVVNNEVRV